MFKNTFWSKVLMAASLTLGLGIGQSAVSDDDPLKVGFVYVGPVGDYGWSYEHDRGRLGAQEHFGDKIKTTYVEQVPEGADAERVIRQMARNGHDIIFTTSFGYMNPTIKVAKSFPNVTFEHATGYKRSENVSTYLLRTYEGRYVSGVAAGLETKTNTIGYIASFPIPEVIRDINTVYMAAKTVNPDVKIKIMWVSTWYDPVKENEAANALIDQGADVILQHTDSPAALIAAEKRGVKGIGQASDMSKFAPNAHMLSVQNKWSSHYIKTIQEVMDKTWAPEDFWGGFKEEMLLISSVNDNLSKATKDAIAKSFDDIKSGKLKPFTGPIYDNQGNLVVKDGHSLTDEELAGVNWYVKGIDATIPK
ncbi:MAG: simple sugar transport system substrate-binding protein [Bermanella sp.]|jgi:simple sugar transport system substrate-binding protein